jgi:hypothetical protein
MLDKSKTFLDMIYLVVDHLRKIDLLGFDLGVSLCDSDIGSHIFVINFTWSDKKHLDCCGGGGYLCVLFASPLGIYVNECLYSQGVVGMTTFDMLVSCLHDRILLCDFRSHDSSDSIVDED